MNNMMTFLFFIFYWPAAWSEPALYKELKLEKAEHILVIGNIEVTLIKSDILKAEVFLRDSSKSVLKIGVQSGDIGKTLVIKEQLPSQFSQTEPSSFAKVNVYLPSIVHVDLQDVATFDMSGFDLNKLYLWARGTRGHGTFNLNHMNVAQLHLHFEHNINLIAHHLNVKKAKIHQNKNTRIALNNSSVNNLTMTNNSNSQFMAENIQVNTLNATFKNSAKAWLGAASIFSKARLNASNGAQLKLSSASFKTLNVEAKNKAVIQLGKADVIAIKAANNSTVRYFPSGDVSVNKRNNALVKPYEHLLEGAYE